MIKKKNIQFFAQVCLCCVVLASAESMDAFSLAPITRATRMGFALIKKIAKAGAVVGGAYWAIRQVLNYRLARYDSARYPAVGRLVVYTDGKVTVRPSDDNSMKVTHKYGASFRSDLPQIGFSEKFDQEHNTLTVQGLLGECHTGKFQQFIRWLFRLQPKRTLHHIIEVPLATEIEITTGNSDRYTHNREQPVHVSSISREHPDVSSIFGNVTVHTVSGNVLVENPEGTAKLKVIRRRAPQPTATPATPKRVDVSRLRLRTAMGNVVVENGIPGPEDKPSKYEVEWDETSPQSTIEVHTPGSVIARNFKGDLRVYGTHHVQAQKHQQNLFGQVLVNDERQNTLQTPVRKNLTQLNAAVIAGNLESVRTLIREGADVNETDKFSKTPLHLACTFGHRDIVHELLQVEGININVQDVSGATPLHAAAYHGNQAIVQELLEAPDINPDIMANGKTALQLAEEMDHQEITQMLQERN